MATLSRAPLPHLHRRNVFFAELAGREHAGNGGMHNGRLLGRPAGEGVAQPLAQLHSRVAGVDGRSADKCSAAR